MRVLVCGSRDYADMQTLTTALGALYSNYVELGGTEFVLIEGEAAGADRMARQWAEAMIDLGYDIKIERYWANWGLYNKRAGYLRNLQMLEEGKPTLVIAFYTDPNHPSKGTKMMVELAQGAGVEVWDNA